MTPHTKHEAGVNHERNGTHVQIDEQNIQHLHERLNLCMELVV